MSDLSVPLKEHFENILKERDRWYVDRFNTLEKLFSERFVLLEKALKSDFASAREMASLKEAIIKAEHAQAVYNLAHNDRVPRPEYLENKKSQEEKLDTLTETVHDLRESFSKTGGKEIQKETSIARNQWIVGTIILICGVGLQILAFIFLNIKKLAGGGY